MILTAVVGVAVGLGGCSSGPDGEHSSAQSQAASSQGAAKSGETFFTQGVPDVHGNGRTCATCHVEADAFQLTPAAAEARYQALQARKAIDPQADDPLFRSIDANDGANDYTNLRQHGLIRVVLKLPVDANGNKLVWPVDDPNATEVGVWRSVPSIRNVAFTAPYQLDGRAPTLQVQALGALHGHSQITNDPAPSFLDAIAAYEKTEFSSPSVAALADALANNQPPPATDPPLDDTEQQGKALFDHHCAVCHGGPTQTVPLPVLAPGIHDAFVSKPVPPFASDLPFEAPPVPPRLWAFKNPAGGDPIVIPSTDPGEALLTGDVNDLNHFDIPALYGISKTAPYFHDNSVADLTGVVRHYQLLFQALQRVIPDFLPFPLRPDLITDDQIPLIVAYLQKI